ncbi:ion channel [Pseudorhodoplanes sp.]|uniref:ion channel n=1 Tax=Pseudorhodoplanes sp. TaxID=1934341 RepID=UPI002C10CF60|nr:ion channel [Pseudorhodoplanes sp.]HWV54149.1 ion channel [Pseudorhodoplanes sp.]
MHQPTGTSQSEVFRYGGSGTVLLIALLLYVGLHPLVLGGTAARLVGGIIVAVILVAGTMAASRAKRLRVLGIMFAVATFGFQVAWFLTGSKPVEAAMMATFAVFCFFTAGVILRHVLSFGPLYADRVHAALSVYILLAFGWAGAYAMIEIMSPGAFSIPRAAGAVPDQDAPLLADMMHLSIATLTSTGFGDITPVAPFARSFSQLEQLTGVFYIAVLISRLIGLYQMETRESE